MKEQEGSHGGVEKIHTSGQSSCRGSRTPEGRLGAEEVLRSTPSDEVEGAQLPAIVQKVAASSFGSS